MERCLLRQLLGGRHPQHLNIGARHAAGRGLEAADEIARADSDAVSELVDRNVAIEVFLQILLGLP